MLVMNTLAFTVCFAAWMLNGVLVTFLTVNQVFNWTASEIGWLLGIPVLTGSIFRLPAGMLTDKYGGKPVMTALLILCSVPMFLLAYVDTYWAFAICSFGFGLVGVSFSIGIAYTSVWFPKEKQGLALGIFGAGNAGSAVTTLVAPSLLNYFTANSTNIEGWRNLPLVYGFALVAMGVLFFLLSTNKKPDAEPKTLVQQLEPLKNVRVWRFGLYYFLVFGCFVAFSQWLVPYFVNVYYLPLVTAGFLAALFSFPSGVIRAVGGWLSDHFGGRRVMYWVLGSSMFLSFLLIVPKMEITSPGKGIMAERDGLVTAVTPDEITVGDRSYPLLRRPEQEAISDTQMLVFPTKSSWQEPAVQVGQMVKRRELVAKGVTKIYFQANVWIFAVLVMLLGIVWGVGKAAVYKHIPEYFPNEVGVVGGMVGVLGGLGGFVSPIIFGYLLEGTGLWTSSWMLMFFLSGLCLMWMHMVIQRMMHQKEPALMRKMETMTSTTWLDRWAPEETSFWETEGSRVAWRTLSITTITLIISFATWFMMSAIVVRMPAIGFTYTQNQLFWLAAMPGLAGGTLRIVHTFLLPIFGTRHIITIATLLKLIPCIGIGFAVMDPTTPYWVFLILAFTAGFGGGDFSSYMPSTSVFFPKRLMGTALGIQAGLGNFGVSLTQFITPMIIGVAMVGSSQTLTKIDPQTKAVVGTSQVWLQNAAFIYVPLLIILAGLSWYLLRSVPIKASVREQMDIFKDKHTWFCTVTYLMTFGGFSGLAAVFPLLIGTLYGKFPNAPDPLVYAFYGPLIGSASRILFGFVADKVGGAILTQICGVAMVVITVSMIALGLFTPDSLDQFSMFVTLMLTLFFFTGMGNAGTFRQYPIIFGHNPRQAAGVIGWTAAIAAYGPFIFSVAIGSVIAAYGNPTPFFYVLAAFFVFASAINWWYYTRRGAERPS